MMIGIQMRKKMKVWAMWLWLIQMIIWFEEVSSSSAKLTVPVDGLDVPNVAKSSLS